MSHFAFYFAGFFLALTGCNSRHAPEKNLPILSPRAAIENAMFSAEKRLVAMVRPDGRFIYREDLDGSRVISPMYNSLRHSGSIYSLAMFEHDFPREETRQTIVRTSHYLVEHFSLKINDGKNKLNALTTTDEPEGSDGIAHLGGAGLGLVALLSAEKLNPNTTQPETLEGLGRFLIFMQKKDGSFYSRFQVGRSRKDDSDPSLYYPGEAILGLVMLYERDGNPDWLNAAEKGLAYLVHHRHKVSDTPPDNWALIATAEIWPYRKKLKSLSESDLLKHVDLIAHSDMMGQVLNVQSPIMGCYGDDGRTTPTSTRLEGMLAILPLLDPTHSELRSTIEKSTRIGIDFLMRSQVHDGPFAGAIPKAAISSVSRQTEIRIDYIQHALSAFIRYRDLHEQPFF